MRSRLPLRLDTSTVTRPPSTFSTTVRPTNASISPLTSVQRRSSTGSIGAEPMGGGTTAAFGDVAAVGTTAGGIGTGVGADAAAVPLAGAAAGGVADTTGAAAAGTDGAAAWA